MFPGLAQADLICAAGRTHRHKGGGGVSKQHASGLALAELAKGIYSRAMGPRACASGTARARAVGTVAGLPACLPSRQPARLAEPWQETDGPR